MADPASFVAVILDYPAEEGPRLVYADWLDERGDPRGEWLRYVSRAHQLGKAAYDKATHPGQDEMYLKHRSRAVERLDGTTLIRCGPVGDGRIVWQLLDLESSRRAVAAAELLACDLLDEEKRAGLMERAEAEANDLEFGPERYAADAAAASLTLTANEAGRDYFTRLKQYLRWIGSRYESWEVANDYQGCLRNLLLKEPHPAALKRTPKRPRTESAEAPQTPSDE